MLSPTDRKLLAALLSRQEETGAAAQLPPERVAEIASGSPPSVGEAAALLASPLARDELALHRRIRGLPRQALPEDGTANDNRWFREGAPSERRSLSGTLYLSQDDRSANGDRSANNDLLFPYRAAAASRGSEGDAGQELLELGGPWASLLIEPGPDDETPYLLTLRLRPEAPGGVAARIIEVREIHPDGLVWLTGRTDDAGVIHAVWAHAGLRPRDRPFASGLRVEGVVPGQG